jgi:hypothetical protein
VKLLIWGIEHSDRYGANTRIYGEVHNSIIGVIEDTRLRIAAIDLARLPSVEKIKDYLCTEKKLTLKSLMCSDAEIDGLIRELARSAEVEDLAARKNKVDLSVPDYFKQIAERWCADLLTKEVEIRDASNKVKKVKWDKWDVGTRHAQICEALAASESLKTASREQLRTLRDSSASEATDSDVASFVGSQYGLARLIEAALDKEKEEEEEEAA